MVASHTYVDKREGDTYLREYLNRLKWVENEVAPLRVMTTELGFQLVGLLLSISRSMGSVKAVGEWLQSLTDSPDYGTTAGHILGVFVGETKKSEWTVTGPRRRKHGRGTEVVCSGDIAQFLPNLMKAIKALDIVVSIFNKVGGRVEANLEIQYLKLKLKRFILRLREAKGMNSDLCDCTVLNMMTIYRWNPDTMKTTSWTRCHEEAKWTCPHDRSICTLWILPRFRSLICLGPEGQSY